MPLSRHRKQYLLNPDFQAWLATQQGIINWRAPSRDAATVRTAYNSGVAGVEDSALFPGAELLVDGDMEAVGVGAWTVANNANLTKETGTRTGGSGTKIIRVARNGTNFPYALQTIVTIGKRYRAIGWVRSDGNATPRLRSSTEIFGGTTSTDWQPFDVEFIADGTLIGLQSLTSTGTEYTEWDDISIREANPLNASMIGSTPAQPFSRGLPYANLYDGNNDFDDLLSDALDTAFPRVAGTFHMFFDYASNLSAQLGLARFGGSAGTDILQIDHSGTGENIRAIYGGASLVTASYSAAHDLNNPHHVACTWKLPGNLTLYFDGVQRDQIAITSLMGATWEMARIGFIPTVYHHGLISDCILDTKEETPIEVAEYYRRWGG